MCQSATGSIIAWVLAVGIGVILYIRNRNYDRWNAIFLWTFSFVQFLEFGMWTFLNAGNVESLSLMTSVLMIALWMQPFVQSYAGYYYISQKRAVLWQELILLVMSLVYVAVIAYAIVRAFDPEVRGVPRHQRVRATIGPNGHLVWVDEEATSKGGSFLNGGVEVLTVLYLIGLIVPVLFMGARGLILATFGLISLGLAYWLSSPQETGSYWSLIALGYGIIALAL